ncbi:MAG: hypothetical protein ACK5QW_02855 [Cyanobacteriota bacterium]
MSVRRWLLLPSLTPLLAVLLVAAFNPLPQLSLRLLTWSTPRAPLGLWLSGAALGGAALSGVGTALALRQGAGLRVRRRVTNRRTEAWPREDSRDDPEWGEAAAAPPRSDGWREARVPVPPPRAPGDPAPTVAVPFRVLHRPPASPGWESTRVAAAAPTPSGTARDGVPSAVEDTWGSAPASDEW